VDARFLALFLPLGRGDAGRLSRELTFAQALANGHLMLDVGDEFLDLALLSRGGVRKSGPNLGARGARGLELAVECFGKGGECRVAARQDRRSLGAMDQLKVGRKFRWEERARAF